MSLRIQRHDFCHDVVERFRIEQDLLWRNLSAVYKERRPRVVVLRGASGTGKSHLAEWLCRRGDELGCAIAVSANGHRTQARTHRRSRPSRCSAHISGYTWADPLACRPHAPHCAMVVVARGWNG